MTTGLSKSTWRFVLPVIAFVFLGWSWAFASPTGSSADETYHLSSIWCAWGDSETCIRNDAEGTIAVPTKVAVKPCFVNQSQQDARCSWLLLSPELVVTDRFNPPQGGYPPAFYSTMRAFVGPDVDRSVLIMRMVNVLIAAALLLWALLLARPVFGRAIAMAWMITLVPTGLFFIASVNPSSWTIIGGSLFWVFLLTFLREASWKSPRALSALAGSVVTALMAALSRSDSVAVLGLSALAVVILEWRRVFSRSRRLWVVIAVLVPLGLLALYFRVGRYLSDLNPYIPPGNELTDQPNPLVKMLLELPAFIGGIFGLQQPIWVQREDSSNWGVDGWVMNSFSFGVGALDVINPSIAGVFGVLAAAGTLMVGLGRNSRPKLLAIAVVTVGLISQMIFMRALGGFGNWENTQGVEWVLQPRYFLPTVMVIAGLIMITRPASRPIFNRVQALAVTTALSIAATTALMAVIARYMHSQLRSWVQFDLAEGWWWSWGPSPVVLIIAGSISAIVFFASMASLGVSYPTSREEKARADVSAR